MTDKIDLPFQSTTHKMESMEDYSHIKPSEIDSAFPDLPPTYHRARLNDILPPDAKSHAALKSALANFDLENPLEEINLLIVGRVGPHGQDGIVVFTTTVTHETLPTSYIRFPITVLKGKLEYGFDTVRFGPACDYQPISTGISIGPLGNQETAGSAGFFFNGMVMGGVWERGVTIVLSVGDVVAWHRREGLVGFVVRGVLAVFG